MYLLLKTVHILGVVLFLGNLVTGLFWKAHADATRDPRLQAHALAGIIRSDGRFTIPSVLLILATGVTLAYSAGLPILGTQWITVSLAAFLLSGALFGAFIGPAQKQLLAMAREAEGGTVPEWPSAAYRRLSTRWEAIGLVAIALPLVALPLMVFKPASLF